MTLETLKRRLNDLAWRRQMDFEASERGAASEEDAIDRDLRALAQTITPALLDALEREGTHPAWVLQLSPHVPGDDPRARAPVHS